ncbi:uncharacterized protein MEPE_05022 [Melanopsichium pennsylvanicum]|uniref:Transmembrane protein 188 n=2 Tax=Melanopsichium pennsylvanicum TaxID=63383 RepID=A0AAJ4XQ82_9BASI|nr:conserved hypothetical protein [Melanopsichium pennsylvanicum 4]SNX86313.1 uncharacterized protein MEPE_05022 [Melanopsichium pennsylvanicum]
MPPKAAQRGRSHHARNASQAANEKEPEESFHPSADAATFRDLLIFEERLKQNAARLQSRKRKYEILLFGFVTFILCLSHFVVLSPRSSTFLQYGLAAVLMICLTTLFLFFASGMHAERIRSANKFVPQANRSLRNFNMYLNTRTAASSQKWSLGRLVRSKNSTRTPNGTSAPSSGTSTPRRAISSIPPAQNSRGELIFSNKVNPEFREGYERYRAAFERRRAQKIAAKRAQSWKRWFDLALGRSVEPAASSKIISSARPASDERRAKTARSSKSRSTRATRSAPTQPESGTDIAGSDAAPIPRSSTQLEDLNEGGLSDDGYPPSLAQSI